MVRTVISRSWLWLFGLAAMVIIIGGLKAVSSVITPFLLAAFLTIICIPPLTWMQKKGIPGWVSFVLLFSTVGFTFFLLFLAIKGTSESLVLKAPLYQERLTEQLLYLRTLATEYGVPQEFIPAAILMLVGCLMVLAAAGVIWFRTRKTGPGRFPGPVHDSGVHVSPGQQEVTAPTVANTEE